MISAIQAFNTLRDEGFITDFAIGGAVGAFFYIESTFTEDVDFFVVLTSSSSPLIDVNPIYRRLTELGATISGEHVRIGTKLVQILVPPSELEEEAIKTSVLKMVGDLQVKVFRPEYLTAIYVKLLRPKDVGKVSEFLKLPELDKKELSTLIERFKLEDRWNRYQKMNI